MTRAVLVLCLLAVGFCGRILQADFCPNSTTKYKIHAIDASTANVTHPNITNNTGCTYRLYLTSGECTIDTPYYPEAAKDYVCFAAASNSCASVNTSSFHGFATINCSGKLTTDPLTGPTNYVVGKEFKLSNRFIEVNMAVGYSCDPSLNETGTNNTWAPRTCTIPGPGPIDPNSNNNNSTNNNTNENNNSTSNETNGDKNITQKYEVTQTSSAISLQVCLAALLVLAVILL